MHCSLSNVWWDEAEFTEYKNKIGEISTVEDIDETAFHAVVFMSLLPQNIMVTKSFFSLLRSILHGRGRVQSNGSFFPSRIVVIVQDTINFFHLQNKQPE